MNKITLYQLVSPIALSMDLAESSAVSDKNIIDNYTQLNYSSHKFTHHTKRTCYIAMRIAGQMNMPKEFCRDLFLASAIHDIGSCQYFDESHVIPQFIFQHCAKGYELSKKLGMNDRIQYIIKYHHENFNGTGNFKIKGDELPPGAKILRLADIIEVLYNESIPGFAQKDDINKWIKANTKTIISEDTSDAFFELQSHESFWLDVENIGFIPSIMDSITPEDKIYLDSERIKELAYAFSEIIDSKSNFTYTHSKNLAAIMEKVCDYMKCSSEKKDKIIVACLLHDVGKLAIPNSILNKNGSLNPMEFSIIKSHSYYTRIILSQIPGFEDICRWASNHHEKIDGSGYPCGLKGNEMSIEEKLIAICDIYEALTAKRPYKKSIPSKEVFKMLDSLADGNKIDREALEIVKAAI